MRSGPTLIHEEKACEYWSACHNDMMLESFHVHDETWTLHLSYKGDEAGDFYGYDEPMCPDCGSRLLIDVGWDWLDPWDWFLPHQPVSG